MLKQSQCPGLGSSWGGSASQGQLLGAAAGTAGPGAGHNGLCVLAPLQPQKGE